MNAPPSSLRDPSTIYYQKDALRRSIIIAYWVIIILALPLWWSTTSIQRLSLPSSRVQEQIQVHLQLPITICLESNEPDFVDKLKSAMDLSLLRDSSRWRGLRVNVLGEPFCAQGSNLYRVIPHDGPPAVRQRELYFNLQGPNAVPQLADTLTSLLAPYSSSSGTVNRVAQYSPRYRLAFSLLNGDAAAGDAVLRWDIRRGFKTYISPILKYLGHLHNFTIESQLQFHAPLSFSPRQLEGVRAVSPDDLSVFVNSAEWTLSSSSSNDPVLHFVLFIPSLQDRPLRILLPDEALSPSNAFILPQWGGIIIHNPQTLPNHELPPHELDVLFSTFASQLLSLLGIPELPAHVKLAPSDSKRLISDWQLDSLIRRRTLENASGSQDALLSIIKLVEQIDNMPVKEDVRDDVEGALSALTKMYNSSTNSFEQTFSYSVESFNLASRAFFNPGMLALLYFPAEHKYAVYTPLFASAVIPVFVAALRELSAWRKEAKQRRGAGASTVQDKEPSAM